MAVKPVVLALSKSGENTAHRIGSDLSIAVHGRRDRVTRADAFFDDTLEHVRTLFMAGIPIIGVCASGILIRGVAPFLSDKRNDPPLISVSDDGSVVVPLLGGHHGANRLAHKIADVLQGKAAVTTAGDVAFGIALDEPPTGWVLANPLNAKSAMATLLNGGGARVIGTDAAKARWLSDLPAGEEVDIVCTTKPWSIENATSLLFHPQTLVLGVGCARACPPEELENLVCNMLARADLAPGALKAIATLDLKADEPAVLGLAKRFGVPLRLFSAQALEAEAARLENPSKVVFAEVGCHGVCEGAALAAAGPDSILTWPKEKSANSTCALACAPEPIDTLRGHPRGRLSVVGIGPGQAGWRTPEASALISEADELVGYGLYIDLLGPLALGKKRTDFPLGGEEARCRYALERAGEGYDVALVCSGDAGIFAMASLVFELLDRGPEAHGVSDAARRVEVVNAPGVSALQGAAARAGAPLGHDFCAISLSDLLTPRADIMKRIKAAAKGDFVIAFYNPVSKRRRTLLAEARDLLLRHRPADTPVMLATSLGRDDEQVRYRDLSMLDVNEVDMMTVVLVGSSHSKLVELGTGSRMYTPRGYERKIDGDLA